METGNPTAQLEWGKTFFNSALAETNVKAGFDLIYRSAEHGNMESQFRLGDLYALGHGTSKSFTEVYKWYTKAAIQGYKKALVRLHNLYQENIRMNCRGQLNSDEEEWASKKFKKDYNIRELNEYRLEQNMAILNGAIDYYTSQFKQCKSSNQSDPVVQLNLAFLYQHGYGVKKCTRWAFEYYTKAAEQGNTDAQYNLGNLYQKHTDMKFNYRHAFKWFTTSAQGGSIAAQNFLAYFYLKGLATSIDYKAALYWYIKAAEAGSSEAQVTLGKLHRKGDYIKQDLSMAVKWYSQAARQGNIVAQNCLSQLHQRGMLDSIELDKDISEYFTEDSMNNRLATKLTTDASKLVDSPNFGQLHELTRRALIGDGQAMYEIGLRYLKGDNDFAQDQDTGVKWIKNAAKAKNKDAQLMIADLYKKGGPVEQDYYKAAIGFKSLAKRKDADSQCNFGSMYNNGLGVRKDPLEASKWYIWSAEQDNSDAQFNLGMLRLEGRGLRQDENDALKWLYRSAHQKNIRACYEIGEMTFNGQNQVEKNEKLGLSLMDFAACNGSIQAQLIMARRFETGVDLKKCTRKAIKYYTMAVDTGSATAQFQLAIFYLKENCVDNNYIEAYILLKQAKDQGYVHAECLFKSPIDHDFMISDYSKVTDMFIEVTEREIDDLHYHIGYIFEHGIGAFGRYDVEINCSKAKEWYLAASKKGDSRADYRLGIMYEYGKEVEEHLDTAINYYQKASAKGNQDANYRLACMYFDGYGTTKDLLKAFQYFTEASTMGHPEARKALIISEEEDLTTMLQHEDAYGRYTFKEITEDTRLSMLEKATNEGFTRLQYQLGMTFLRNRDYSHAFELLLLAADQGIADAYYRLGECYKSGRGVEYDIVLAESMYRMAVEKKHKNACYSLGQLYQDGRDVQLDYLKAYCCYKKAADMGHVEARKILALILETNLNLNRYASGDYFKYLSTENQNSIPMLIYAAENGDIEVQFRLGFACEHNILVAENWESNYDESNYDEALKWYSMATESSHKGAMYRLGLLYEYGLGVSCDYQKSTQLYQRAGELGSGDALYQLGNAYRYGRGVEIDFEKAMEYYIRSAEPGKLEYQCSLGEIYEEGEIVEKQVLEALKWYTKAYLQGDDNISSKIDAIYKATPYEDFFFKKLFRNLSIASHGYFRLKKYYNSCDYLDLNNRLGALYILGYGTGKDLEKACDHFSKLYSDKSNSFSVKNILDLEYGLGFSEKRVILTKFEENDARLEQIEDENQLFELGMSFFDWKHIPGKRMFGKYIVDEKKFIETNYSRALKCIKKAAKKKHSNAIVQLGIMYHCGYGVEKNDRKGEQYFNDALLVDNEITGCIPLLYHTHEAMQDFILAKKWYTRLQGVYIKKTKLIGISEPVQIGLGLLYEYGDGVQQDYRIASGFYKKLVAANISSGFHHLGLMHYYGKGVSVDYTQSFDLFQKAINAQEHGMEIPSVYEQNNSSRGDSKTTLVYSTMNGYELKGESYYYLGLHYKHGQGVYRSKEESQEYFRKALDRRCKRAAGALRS